MDQSDDALLAKPELSFESLKKHNQHETEYWSARDLQPCLGYSHWRDFKNAIKKAIKSCEQSRNDPKNHFADARKMVGKGKTGKLCPYYFFEKHLQSIAAAFIWQTTSLIIIAPQPRSGLSSIHRIGSKGNCGSSSVGE